MNRGELVPDNLTVPMVLHRIEESDCVRGVLLDGFPRTISQAQVLDKGLQSVGRQIDLALYLTFHARNCCVDFRVGTFVGRTNTCIIYAPIHQKYPACVTSMGVSCTNALTIQIRSSTKALGYLFQRDHSSPRLLRRPAEAGRSEWQCTYRSVAEGAFERDTRPSGTIVM